ncbi:unnamed protein product [Linum trigynum]|uniref:Uncharacterized protein n=1 Tax=Linum trigynum TaxID=586398 RepID=A0AAV2FNU5_9ROSI
MVPPCSPLLREGDFKWGLRSCSPDRGSLRQGWNRERKLKRPTHQIAVFFSESLTDRGLLLQGWKRERKRERKLKSSLSSFVCESAERQKGNA